MSYLLPSDYLPLIQTGNQTAITGNNPAAQAQAELAAQAEAVSFLKQKYDTTAEFTDTGVWNPANTYNAFNRVYLNAPAWQASAAYTTGDMVLLSANVYQCATPNSDSAFTAGNWMLLGAQYTIFYAIPPYPVFNLLTDVYAIGDKVFWNNRVYTCAVPTYTTDHETALQYRLTQNLPYNNVFPNDPAAGLSNWGTGTPYSVAPSTGILNTTYWSMSDNRDQQLVQKLVDITLFHLHAIISPQNIPALRSNRYKGEAKDQVIKSNGEIIYPVYSALGWLQACARGEVTPNLPVLQPPQGNRVRFGGMVRNVNGY